MAEGQRKRRVLLAGGGVIGQGWAAHLLAGGHEVVVVDPQVGRDDVARFIDRAEPAVSALGGDLSSYGDRLTVATELSPAVTAEVDWVQENGPEIEGVKSALFARLDELVDPSVVIASSTSGTTPTRLSAHCRRAPGRVVVGHPYNPFYVVPLFVVVGGAATDTGVVQEALAFYASVGKRPIHVRHEVPGHLANRLQAALWREAYSLVERGVATAADVDAAIAHGPGLRWAILGPLVNQHLSGGSGGLRHVLEHLGPATQIWMDDLGAPQLTPALVDALVTGVDDELADVDQEQLVAQRDALLVELLRGKQQAKALP